MHTIRELKNQPPAMRVLFVATLINRAGTMAVPFLSLYLIQARGFSGGQAGAILGGFGVGSLVTTLFAGWWSDRIGAVRLMVLSLFSSSIALLIFPWLNSLVAVWFGVIFLAVTTESFRPALYSATAHFADPAQKRMGFAVIRFAINLGMSLGPALGGFIAKSSFAWLFWLNAVATFVAACVVSRRLLARNAELLHPVPDGERQPSAWRSMAQAARDPLLVAMLVGMLPVLLVFFQHESSMPVFMVRNLGLDETWYGLIFSLNTILIVLLEIPLNHATREWTFGRQFFWGGALVGIGFGILGLWPSLAGVIVSVAFWTFGEMMLFPALGAYVDRVAPKAARGTYLGLQGAAFALALIVGPWLGIMVLDRFGPRLLWGLALVLGLAGAFYLRRLRTVETV